MRLGVNGWRLRTRAGVGRVVHNVLRYWTPEFVSGRFDEITVYSPVELAPDLPIPDWIGRRVVGPDLPMLAWENCVLPFACDDDVLLCPSYTRPIFTRSNTVSIIYEATQKLYPQYYPTRARFINTPLHQWSARHSTRVVTNTEQARADIVTGYGAPSARMRVVPLAPAEIFHANYSADRLEEVRQKFAGGKFPYFLYVGTLTARRNVPHLITALAEMRRSGSFAHRLVIVGRNSTNIDIAGMAAELGISDEVKYYPFVEDEDLAPLYSAAEAFVLPYSYESAAALTLLEAQAAGTAAITAGTVGLKEAAGDAALFVPDVAPSSLAAAMRQIAEDKDLRVDLVKRGSANAAQYTWQRCAAEMLDICQEAASA